MSTYNSFEFDKILEFILNCKWTKIGPVQEDVV